MRGKARSTVRVFAVNLPEQISWKKEMSASADNLNAYLRHLTVLHILNGPGEPRCGTSEPPQANIRYECLDLQHLGLSVG